MGTITKNHRFLARPSLNGGAKWLCLFLLIVQAQAQDASFDNYLAQGGLAGKRGDVTTAVRFYSAAEQLESVNSSNLCALTKCFCDLMHVTSSPTLQKTLAQKALACSQAATKADPQNATAHICVAICYAKNFPYADNATKVFYSRSIKMESEKAIALDPKQDVARYMLGRWNYGVANMNLLYKGLVKTAYGGLPVASNAEAVKDFQQAIRLDPSRVISHAELAKVYQVTGQKELARLELGKCARLKPLDPDDAEAQIEAARELSALTE
jgi:tetratricopeptide (TPR) repeat protein